MVEHPAHLRGGEVRIDDKTGARPDIVGQPGVADLVTDFSGAMVLPDDGIRQRPPRGTLPDNRGFALVGDAYGRDIVNGSIGRLQCLPCDTDGRFCDLDRIMLHPTGSWEDLRQFFLRGAERLRRFVENNGTRRRCALVDGEDYGI